MYVFTTIRSVQESKQCIDVLRWLLSILKPAVTLADLVLVAGAAGTNLRAPQGSREIVSGSIPLSLFHQRVEGVKASKPSFSKVVCHVNEYGFGTAAGDRVAVDLLLAASGNVNFLV